MQAPRVGMKVIRVAPSGIFGIGGVYTVTSIKKLPSGTWIHVGHVSSREEMFWTKWKPCRIFQLENK